MNCRACGSVLSNEFVDLGFQPLSNSYLRSEQLVQIETFLPLKAMVCSNCLCKPRTILDQKIFLTRIMRTFHLYLNLGLIMQKDTQMRLSINSKLKNCIHFGNSIK